MRQFDKDRMLSLIGLIYDAALDEKLWPGLAGAVATTFEASSMGLRLRSARTGTGVSLASTDNLLFQVKRNTPSTIGVMTSGRLAALS